MTAADIQLVSSSKLKHHPWCNSYSRILALTIEPKAGIQI